MLEVYKVNKISELEKQEWKEQVNSERRKQLIKLSLENKWSLPQSENKLNVSTPCSFCIEAWLNNDNGESENCEKCLVPKDLCDDLGKKGKIGELVTKYGNIPLSELPESEFMEMREKLMELI